MSLRPGQVVSEIEVLEPLGAGAMGVVFRARDLRLGREVAVKVLPEPFASDADRLARFEREARALAALNHPGIAQIYRVDRHEGAPYLVLELVPGESLEERLARGPLPVEDAVELARQVADALDVAHEAGVVHRDLKPANVRVTPEGAVKLLDFGLAKAAREPDGGGGAASTEAGRVLGTPQYMAPEQARGRAVDRRVDLWSLGCLLYECLTGARPFGGESVTDVLVAVLQREPDLARLPAGTPAGVRELLARCFEKDPRARLRDAGEARVLLERAFDEDATRPERRGQRRAWRAAGFVLAGLLVGVALTALAWRRSPEPARGGTSRRLELSLQLPDDQLQIFPRVAPDGSGVVHEGVVGVDGKGEPIRGLLLRNFASTESRPLDGTEHPETFCFAPDGRSLAALVRPRERDAGLDLVRVDLTGAEPTVRLAGWPRGHSDSSGIAWLPDGRLVSSTDDEQLLLLDTADGTVERRPMQRALERVASTVDVFRAHPDGRHVLGRAYYYAERGFHSAVVLVDVESGACQILMRNAEHAALHGPERLLFTRRDVLYEVALDPDSSAPLGEPRALASGLRTPEYWRAAWFDLARDGTLIWLAGGRQGAARRVARLDHSGELAELWPDPMPHDGEASASPGSDFLTTTIVDDDGLLELWGAPRAEPRPRKLLAAPGTDHSNGTLVPGTDELVFLRLGALEPNGVLRAPLSDLERAELLLAADDPRTDLDPLVATPDGSGLLLLEGFGPERRLLLLDLTQRPPPAPRELFVIEDLVSRPELSPDGRWLAWVSDRERKRRILVRRFSTDGCDAAEHAAPVVEGAAPAEVVWIVNPASGRLELVFREVDDRRLFRIPLESDDPPRFGAPAAWARLDELMISIDPGAAGELVLCLYGREELSANQVHVSMGLLDPVAAR